MKEAELPSGPEVERLWAELRLVLDREIAALPERFRLPIVMVYYEGLANERVARELEIAPNTLRWRLQQGLERLRARLRGTPARLSIAALAALLGARAAEAAAPTQVFAPRASVAPAGTSVLTEVAGLPGGENARALADASDAAESRSRMQAVAAAVLLVAMASASGWAVLAGRVDGSNNASARAGEEARASLPANATTDEKARDAVQAPDAAALAARNEDKDALKEAARRAAPELPPGPPAMDPDQVPQLRGGQVVLWSRNRYGNYPLATYAFHLGERGDGRDVRNEVNLIYGNVVRESAFKGETVDGEFNGSAGMDAGRRGSPDEFRVFTRSVQNKIVDLGAADYQAVVEAPAAIEDAGYRAAVAEGHVYVVRFRERSLPDPEKPVDVKLRVLRHRDNDAVLIEWAPLEGAAPPSGEDF